MQNTIVREFEGNADVVTLLFNQGGVMGEDYDWMKTFWDNLYLRGTVVHDAAWVAANEYLQPNTNLPFGRGFVIDRDGTVALPHFGHNPKLVIDTIHDLLDGTSVPGDNDWSQAGESALLLQSRPNPTSSSSVIAYTLPAPGDASVRVYDVSGREVAVLAAGRHEAGEHTAVWGGLSTGGQPVGSGIYFVRLETAAGALARKIVLVR